MAFKVMADNNQDILAKHDGALYNVALNNEDIVVKGLGQEMNVTYSNLVVSVGRGEALVHGRHIVAEEVNQITLPQNERGYLTLRIDLTQSPGNEALLYATPILANDEINWGNGIYDMVLGEFVTDSSKITKYTDKRNVSNNSIDKRLGGLTLLVLTQAEYDAMGSGRPSNTLYIIKG